MNDEKYINLMKKEKDRIKKFCDNLKDIYIYGAGNYGYIVAKYVERNNISVKGYMVTKRVAKEFVGKPVINVPVYSKEYSSSGIILATSSKFLEDIEKTLKNNGWDEEKVLKLDDRFLMLRRDLDKMLGRLEDLNKSYPPKYIWNEAEWKKICVICNDGIGDLIMTTPFLRELKQAYHQCSITLVTTPEASSLFEICPYIDNLLVYDHRNMFSVDIEIENKVKKFAGKYLVKECFDVAFLPASYVWATINTYMVLYSRIPIRIGNAVYGCQIVGNNMCNRYIEKIYSLVVKDEFIQHEVQRRLSLLRVLDKNIKNTKMELWLSKDDREYAYKLLNSYNISNKSLLVALAPVASGASRCWDITKFLTAIQMLVEQIPNIKFVLLGARNTEVASELFSLNVPDDNIINLVNKTTLREAAAIVENCKMYLGMNTGLMSVAAAFGVPVVEICVHPETGVDGHDNSPSRYRAWGVDDIVVRPKKGLEGCEEACVKTCAHCINQIGAEEVYKAVMKMIKSKKLYPKISTNV